MSRQPRERRQAPERQDPPGQCPLRRTLVQTGHAAGRARGTYLGAQYHRLAGRRGTKRAAVAVGHTILVIAYHLLAQGTTYAELGPDYCDRRNTDAIERQLVKRLERLGNKVTIEKVA